MLGRTLKMIDLMRYDAKILIKWLIKIFFSVLIVLAIPLIWSLAPVCAVPIDVFDRVPLLMIEISYLFLSRSFEGVFQVHSLLLLLFSIRLLSFPIHLHDSIY